MRTRSRSNRLVEGQSGPHDSEHLDDHAVRSSRGKATSMPEEQDTSRKKSGAKQRRESKPLIKKSKYKLLRNLEEPPRIKCKGKVNAELSHDAGVKGCSSGSAREETLKEEDGGASGHFDASEMDWEEGTISSLECREVHSHDLGKEVTVEFTDSPSAERKTSRRASAEEKELAELVHKVHLLCLLARGRMVDKVCNDPLIQASILSLLPSNLLKIAEVPKLTANKLESLVNWFQSNFHLTTQCIDKGSFESNLAFALQNHEGTAEEVAALSVALFRALNLTTREIDPKEAICPNNYEQNLIPFGDLLHNFQICQHCLILKHFQSSGSGFVSVLDVVSLKPDADIPGILNQDVPRLDTRIFSPTTTVESTNQIYSSPVNSMDGPKDNTTHGALEGYKCDKKGKACIDNSPSSETKCAGPKRKGDLEFELQLGMALSATASGNQDNKVDLQINELTGSSPSLALPIKKSRKSKAGEPSKFCSSNAIWSRRTGPPLYWAEVYCSGEALTGRWVHVDAANAIIDGEEKVEAAAAVCRRPLKYVIAFAGNGAKDVTRRYCMQWYKIASRRINSEWWDKVLAPLKELESSATGVMVQLETFQEETSSKLKGKEPEVPCPSEMNYGNPTSTTQECATSINLDDVCGGDASKLITKSRGLKPPAQIPEISCIEDMELETRALTEPLPTNQLAYKNHHLYAIERWLTKNQIFHPKGPVLGYCSGHPVYPRSCVQTLQTRQKWLREGLQVRPNEIPAKIIKSSKQIVRFQSYEPSVPEEDEGEPTVELYGKWQLEPLQLPHAANGIVPKNERGQVEVWSERCVPPGAVHLRLPRLVPVAKRLEIDYAPAMVGFEFRNGRSFPIFEGIVVCAEFKDAILEAYVEVEERRECEERKRNEAQALSRWFQLLSSIITRQRLKNSYVSSSICDPHKSPDDQKNSPQLHSSKIHSEREVLPRGAHERLAPKAKYVLTSHEHEHVFPVENESFDEEILVRTKRCPCGFSIQVEEL
ncbi:DNA repair protein RAD4 isoform X2 [Typha latifolia]|uniref:DNA repair protein RAD4 isoform X2 n=1 Tax=Typha latifolia TaxID=4733 RepID=UPI003C2CDD1C